MTPLCHIRILGSDAVSCAVASPANTRWAKAMMSSERAVRRSSIFFTPSRSYLRDKSSVNEKFLIVNR